MWMMRTGAEPGAKQHVPAPFFTIKKNYTMKKIIIALDYHPSAQKVAEKGYEIAKALHADITLVHVIADVSYYGVAYSPIMGYQGNFTDEAIGLAENIRKEATNFLASAVKHLGDESIQISVLADDDIENAILHYSSQNNADMIIMGSHSHKGLGGIFATALAAHVLKHSAIPLLTIPVGAE